MKKKRAKIIVKNGMRDKFGEILGRSDSSGKVEINVKAKAHKDKRELASTLKHELLHVKHPNMTEKETYKRSRKTKISPQEESQLLSKVRMKKMNYKLGAAKRKLHMKRGSSEPGAIISQMNAQKDSSSSEGKPEMSERERVAISGLV